jgi:Leucine-rich repeat (LRR) protein
VVHNVPQSEINALHDLYESTGGRSWLWRGVRNKWNFTSPNPCAGPWQGITCSPAATAGFVHVQQLKLSVYKLAGYIPQAIANLSQLQVVDLSSNFLVGTIPLSVGWLTMLQTLDLHNNQLTGTIPNSLDQLTRLTELDIATNFLRGTVPDSLGQLEQLSTLKLQKNLFTGQIPASLGNLRRLNDLELSSNQLNGTIPRALGQLAALTQLYLWGNQLTGTIPTSLGNLTQVTNLELSVNRLRGTIPNSLGRLTDLTVLYLYENELTGTIPSSLGQLVKLTKLQLNSNWLRGTIPESLGQLQHMDTLDLDSNYLSGAMPESLGQMTLLTKLYLWGNRLTGTIPDSLGQLKQLSALFLNSNSLRGAIPESLGQLTLLTALYLQDNKLTGTIPDTLAACRRLSDFEINHNELSGTVPEFVVLLPGIVRLSFQNNGFTGTLPEQTFNGTDSLLQVLLCNNNMLTGTLPNSTAPGLSLRRLVLSSNRFSGTIPSNLIAALHLVDFLFLDNNQLTGAIPQNWSATANTLQYLSLQDNNLSGSISESLGQLLLLQNLNLSSNRLTGTIPSSFRNLTSLQVLMLQNNQLRGTVADLFGPSQTNLSTVQLSNNQLTGTLPAAAFLLPSLSSFAAVDNCFEGPLPEEAICTGTSLNALVLDGLHSKLSCKRRSSTSHKTFNLGTLPLCLLTLPRLVTLHLSGSGLTGSLPAAINISAVLADLSLSHNLLTGKIPGSILERDWNKLDLSYNRLTGTLHSARAAPYSNASRLYLQHNRLSGVIPGSMHRVGSLSLLENNMFSCRVDHSDVPQQNPDSDKYTCGSEAVNNALYVWLGAAVVVVAAASVAVYSGLDVERPCSCLRAVRDEKLRNLLGHFRGIHKLYAVGTGSAAYCLVVLLPVYAVVSAYQPSFTYKYAWTVSGVFLTGTTAFALEAVFLLLQLPVCAYVADQLVVHADPQVCHRAATVADTQSTSGPGEVDTRSTLAAAAVMLLSLVAVTGINVGFVVATLNLNGRQLTAIQVLLAVFKLGFNNVVIPALENRVKTLGTEHGQGVSTSQLLLVILSTIVIPCAVVMVVSPACFYDALKRTDPVTSSYEYSGDCLSFTSATDPSTGSQTLACAGAETAVGTTTYTPPFTYSYQCSSSFVTSYAPTFTIMCIISGFVVPAYHLLLLWLRRNLPPTSHLYPIVIIATPRILGELPSPLDLAQVRNSLPYRPVLEANKLVMSLLTYLALLLTFGALFPPLAVCCAVAMASVVLTARLEVGRYVSAAVVADRQDCLDEVESACAGVATPRQLRTALYLVLTVGCMFYTLFLFDTLGYEVGFAGAFWVLIAVPLLPVVFWALHTAVGSVAAPCSVQTDHSPELEVGVALADLQAAKVAGTKAAAESGMTAGSESEYPDRSSASPMHAL